MKKTVALGLLGPILDMGKGGNRWERWRPSVALCQQEDLLIHRFEILFQKRYASLATRIVRDIKSVSPETEVVTHEINMENPWDFEEVFGALHDFARARSFDPEREDYLIHITTGTHVAQICLYLLTESHYFPGRLIQTGPRGGVKGDPKGTYSIIDLDLSKYDRIAMRFRQETTDDITLLKSGIETRNREFNALIEKIELVGAKSVHPILLTGPTGAGKSSLARRIFQLRKARRGLSGAFVEVNCATLRGDGAMSALFGHKRGAFTGATHDRGGLLRAAHGGVLFLDEVGELGPDEQSMLLRAVEEKRFLPVGADEEIGSDFQLICGTNRDLFKAVDQGRFREDLLARINLWTFYLPGLRERPEDIEPNLHYELDRFAELSGARITFTKEAIRRFLSFATSEEALWSANFRDLNGAVTRMATLTRRGRITPEEVEDEILRLKKSWGRQGQRFREDLLHEIMGKERSNNMDRFDRVQLLDVLEVCRNSRSISHAGRALFAVTRERKKRVNDADRLRKYLARFNLKWEDIK